MKRWDIGTRVLLAAIVPATLIAVSLAWFFTYERIGDLERELRLHGAAIARQLAPACEYGVFSGNRDFLRQLVDAAVSDGGVDGVAVFDRDGGVLVQSGALHPEALRGAPRSFALELRHELPGALLFVAPIGRAQSDVDDLFPEPSEPESAVIGSVLVQMSLTPLEERKRELVAAAMAITAIGLFLAIWLAQTLSADVVRPVMQIAATVGRIKGGDLGARAQVETGGSLTMLASGINDMASALEAGQQDLEQRVKAATAALQRQKEVAEQANRTKTQFLAAASHDLRQPIQAAGLFVSALRLRAKDEETQRMVSRIERALANLDAVLDGLLDISRLDAGAITPRPEPMPVNRLFGSLRETFAATAAESGLALRVAPSAAWCRSDPLLLERVMSNLVANALRYTTRGGVVIGCRRRGANLRIEVWDTGVGIPEDKRREIFREFVRLENSARGRDKGLGLGLAIVDRLSRLLEHPVTLRSRVGRGTVFAVDVPRAAPPLAAPAQFQRTAAPVDFGGRRILVVDDDPDVLDSLRMFLVQVGAEVTTAASAAEARRVALAAAGGYDCVLSDYRLPDGDGIGLVNELRCGQPSLPAIVITGETERAVLQQVTASGLPCMHKPVTAEALRAALERTIGAGTPA